MTLLKPTDPLRVQAVLHFAVQDCLALVCTCCLGLVRRSSPRCNAAAADTLCQTLLHEGDGSVGAQSEAQKLAQETLDEAVPLLDALSQSEYEATTAVLKVRW